MEIRRNCLCVLLILVIAGMSVHAQPPAHSYTIKEGRMYISLARKIKMATLDSFMSRYNLNAIGLFQFIRTRSMDSLKKLGWRLEMDRPAKFVISKPLLSSDYIGNPAGQIILTEKHPTMAERFPAVNNGLLYGYNLFRRKLPFVQNNGWVTIFLRGSVKAGRVNLTGSFNNWLTDALAMTKTDSGWVTHLRLSPGKYWYKFIIDGNWSVDADNLQSQNDGYGNTNSVFYVTNTLFTLNGFTNARKVGLSGSFNDWQPDQLRMFRTAAGWELPVYLADGTHTYRYVVDGNWIPDPANKNRLPNEFGDFNSYLIIGANYTFHLKGYANARSVCLAGDFDNWSPGTLAMKREGDGWTFSVHLSVGKHLYKYVVDGEWMRDPGNELWEENEYDTGNSIVWVEK